MLVKERDQLAKIDRLERAHSKELQNERYTREEVESDLKDKVKQFESEVRPFFTSYRNISCRLYQACLFHFEVLLKHFWSL